MTLEVKAIIFASLFNRQMNRDEREKFSKMSDKTFAQTIFNNSGDIRTIVYEKYPQLKESPQATYEPVKEQLYRKKG